ncbi:MAG: sodium/glutamate symporter [Betaproteobacteria bacterium]
MVPLQLNELFTLILAILAILLGIAMTVRWSAVRASNIPPAVLGGLVFACIAAGLHATVGLELEFATGNRNALLLIFFVGLGLAAKFSGLRQGGVQVALFCVAIAVVIVAQNIAGIELARAFGMEPALGLFVGSIPLLGGHGTAAAWAQAPEAAGLPGAFELGIAAATLGLVAGGLTAGPVATVLARLARIKPANETPTQVDADPAIDAGAGLADILRSDRWLRALLLIAVSMAIGQGLQWIAGRVSVTVPAFLTAMFGGIILTNLADVVKRPVDFHLADLISTIALRLFLAMAMLSLKLWALLAFIGLLSAMVVAQIAVATLVAALLVFPAMGRDRQAAVAAGGFIGFALGAMPVGLGTMRRLSESLGPAPRAFLVITLSASLFADAANALGISAFFALLK